MIQGLLTILLVVAAVIYLGYYMYRQTFAKKNKCEGCTINKIYQMKVEREKKMR